MSKLKKVRSGNFTQISNIIFDDSRLSYKEIGLYCNMMKFPDDWEFSIRYLADQHQDKKAAVTTGIEKLIELGYIVRTGKQFRNKQGMFGTYDYVIYEDPMDNPIFIPYVSKKSARTVSDFQTTGNFNAGDTVSDNQITDGKTSITVSDYRSTEKPSSDFRSSDNQSITNIVNTNTVWILSVQQRYRQCQMKASVSVNREMLLFYWSLGRDIVSLQAESKWGSKVLDQVSHDLHDTFPNAKGFSTTNLKYMRRFYELYHNAIDDNTSFDLSAQAVPGLSSVSENEIGAQTVHQLSLEELAMVPWGHHRQIIINSKGDAKKAVFFVRKVIENNWSRGVLMNFLDTDLYERSGKAISNFQLTLPKPQSDLAQEMTRDPYNFDFIAIQENYDEKDLKDALMNQVQDFLLELGTGFAFVGREYRLVVGETEQFIDMLFYNIQEHCYVVVEVKVVDFEPGFIGQLGTYIVAVDRILRKDNNKTVGLLICKTKDNILAQYATDSSSEPIGVSQYRLTNLLPAEYRRSMPTIEEIEQELSE